MAVNLSDIAGKGGRPLWALIGLALPAPVNPAEVEALYEGMRQAASPHGVAIVGGDTSLSPSGWFVNVTLLGEHLGAPRLRSAARPRAPRSPWSARSGLSKASPSSTRAACPSRCAPATSTSVDSLEVLELLSLGALILLSALLTGAEAAYFSLGRARLKRLAEEQ